MRRRTLSLLCSLLGPLSLLGSLSLAGCKTSSLGTCAQASECKSGSSCDLTQDPPVCVVQQGACFPVCPSGKQCKAGSCVSLTCDPACDATHVCDQATITCVDVTTPQIAVTSPAPGGYVTGTGLQATASARAPGGVTAVEFRLQSATGGVLTHANGKLVPTAADPANWAATVALGTIADGPVQLVALEEYGPTAQTAVSEPVSLLVDRKAPLIALVPGNTNTVYAGGAVAQLGATVSDGQGSGVDPASVTLTLDGVSHAPYPGTTAGGQYNFSVRIDDSVLAAGSSAVLHFHLDAKDKAGNSARLAGQAGEIIRADRDAPRIAQISVVTPPDYVNATTGRGYYLNDAGPLSVTAQITDFAGVDPAAVCLHVSGESAGCAHQGSTQDGGSWSFLLPRPALDAQDDGTSPTRLSITADDSLARALDAGVAEHRAASDAGAVYFDNVGPQILVAPDLRAIARTNSGLLTISATITAPVGLDPANPPQIISGGNASSAVAVLDGGVFQFALATADAPQGSEGQYAFDITAQDNLGHVTDALISRLIDDAPPTLSLKIYTGREPAGAGVTYPPAVAQTGWTGSLFLYNDVVHVKGSLTDLGGLAAAGATVHIDGVDVNGGATSGAPLTLSCTDRATVCSFDVPVALNAPGNGPFNTGTANTPDLNGNLLPTGTLQITIEAQDHAVLPDGTPAPNASTTPFAADTTRFWWQATLPSIVTGLALHPDGDLIVTTQASVVPGASADTVFSLAGSGQVPDAGMPALQAVHWSAGADAGVNGNQPLGTIPDQPAIGAGDAASAAIYVATAGQSIAALNPNGSTRWRADSLEAFSVGPAVGSATVNGGTVEQVFVPSNIPGTVAQHLWAAYDVPLSAPVATSGTFTNAKADGSSSPILLNGFVWYGDANGIAKFPYGDGTLGAGVHSASVIGPYFDLVTDGTNLFAANNNGVLWAFGQNFTQLWKDGTLNPNASPIFGTSGLLISDTAKMVDLIDPGSGNTLGSASPGKNALTPLQGAGGRVFVPRLNAVIYAYEQNGKLAWYFDPPNNIFRGLQLDCAGHLFLATDSTVYALITDDKGLGDTAWPTYRRDGRNSGNASAPKYGIRSGGSCAP